MHWFTRRRLMDEWRKLSNQVVSEKPTVSYKGKEVGKNLAATTNGGLTGTSVDTSDSFSVLMRAEPHTGKKGTR